MKHYDYEANKAKLFDSTGRALTTGLFDGVFDKEEWHRLYVEAADPTEYDAAMVLIGNWEHWQVLRKSKTLAELFDKWRMEVEVKLRSEAIKSMVRHSKQMNGAAAAKWLAEAGFVERDKRTKKGKEEEKQIGASVSSQVQEDAERLGLKVVNGGKEKA
jgi:hypothetical protein